MPGYSKVPKLVNAVTKAVVKATMGSAGKPVVKKAYPKPVKPTAKKSSPAVRSKTDAIQKNSVKVKPAAKQKPNRPNAAKTTFKNDSSRNRTSDRTMKEFEQNVRAETGGRPRDPSYSSKLGERAGLNTKLKRKPNLKLKGK